MRIAKLSFRIAIDAFRGFLADDGWAIASHIALSTLMALFPFLIVVTALAGFFFGSKHLADEAAKLLLEAWPKEVAAPIAADITRVLTGARGDVLTFGVLFALYFASSGVESLRVGLNRAYNASEQRAWWLLRLESIVYVLVGAAAILAFAFLVVLEPLIWAHLVRYVPALAPFDRMVTLARYGIAALGSDRRALYPAPAGCRRAGARFLQITPGHRRHAAAVAGQRRGLRALSRLLRLRLCLDVCGAGVRHDRAGVSLCLRVDLHLRRRAEFTRRRGSVEAARRQSRRPVQ